MGDRVPTLLLLFDRLPAWLPGCYGGTPTPAIDELATSGHVADFVFVTAAVEPNTEVFSVRRHIGVPADLAAETPQLPGTLNRDVKPDDWAELLQLWQDDGFDLGNEPPTPGDLPELLSDAPELLSDDLRYESDAAAQVALTLQRLFLSEADAWVAEQLTAAPVGTPIAITACGGGGPLPRPEDPLLDIERHVPLIAAGIGRESPATRESGLIDVCRFVRTGQIECSDELAWSDEAGKARRTSDQLAVLSEDSDGHYVRRFNKPDDRFCQLNVAAAGETEF